MGFNSERVKPHLYHVMVREHSRAGGLQALSVNIAYVRSLSLSELGFSDADQVWLSLLCLHRSNWIR